MEEYYSVTMVEMMRYSVLKNVVENLITSKDLSMPLGNGYVYA